MTTPSTSRPRAIGVVTTSRADYSYYRPILRRIVAAADLRLVLYVTGMHLCPQFGSTVCDIERDGFEIAERIDMHLGDDSPAGIATSMGHGLMGFAQEFARARPDILIVLGDRFEMLAAAAAAVPFNIPLAHIAGGEATEGAIDEVTRHAITKLSHLHFVQTETYGRRVRQMGEDPWRIVVAGAASLDNLRDLTWLKREELAQRFGLTLDTDPLVVTLHSTTLEPSAGAAQARELMAALDEADLPVVFTSTNADTNNGAITREIEVYLRRHDNARAVASLGTAAYFSLLKFTRALVGNSSSGICEAATFKLPVVNIGSRQAGRVRDRNVIDVPFERRAIAAAIRQATSSTFRESLSDLRNSYGEGHASAAIVETLRTVALGSGLLTKRFVEVSPA